MKNIFLLLSLFIASACNNGQVSETYESNDNQEIDTLNKHQSEKEDQYGIESADSKHAFSARIIFTDTLGWGYQIFDGNQMMINQVHIPAIQGNKGFKSRQSAQITANFVLYKLSNNIFPPTVDAKELDSLGVL